MNNGALHGSTFPLLRATDDGVSISDDEIAVSPAAFFTMVHFHKERFMKPENKIPVLTRLSDEMTAVVNFQQPGLPLACRWRY
ncbi:acetyl esterase [Salmonella enterica subsp. enterica serovar Heidelberg str. 83-1068]|nr:acetyl esterase [Salmonella enterica subsp. enterica serovar Heidelberg str. 83-1068]